MNFDWTPEEESTRDALMALLDADTRTALDALESADDSALEGTIRAQLLRLGAVGYLGIGVGPEGLTRGMRLLACQEALAAASGSLFLAAEASARLCGGLVAAHGTDALKGILLGPLQAGEAVGAVARADREDASPAIAEADGDQVVVTGSKAYVTNGPFADWIAVVARMDGKAVVALVPGDAPGLFRGHRLATLGCRGLSVCPITLKGVRIPRTHLMGPFATDDPLAQWQRTEDLILAVHAVGVAHRSFEAAKTHAGDHQRGGKPIMGYQGVRFRLAELLTLLQTAELTCRRAAWLVVDKGGPDSWDADTVVRCAKVFAAETAERISAASLQILAGRGYEVGNPVEQAFRDAQYAGLAGTTSMVCRMEIADAMLDRYQP